MPAGTWDYFCLDQVRYHGRWLTILYDKTGERYHQGKGLRVFADGTADCATGAVKPITASVAANVRRLDAPHDWCVSRPETSAGWLKSRANPVMGGKYGTCFDISVLKEGGLYRMWLLLAAQASVALVESKDGIHWSEPPEIVLGPRRADELGRRHQSARAS